MLGSLRAKLRDLDWHLLVAAAVLIGIGLCFIWSASLTLSKGGVSLPTQLSKILLSLPCLLLAFWISGSWLRRNAYILFGLSLLGLIGLYFFGLEKNNSRRWFSIGGSFLVQPSEFVKLTLILALAKLLMYRRKVGRLEGLVLPALLLGFPLALIVRQPDLGTALVLIPIWFAILFAAGGKKRHLLTIGALGIALVPIGYFFLRPYQRERVDVWLRQDSLTAFEKRNQGYHLYNAKISIGLGGWAGHGLGQGPQNQRNGLPERHTDFIAALIAEEGGFLGAGAAIVLYLLLVLLIFGIALRLREPFGRLVVVGIGAYFMTHLFVNVGVASGLLPTTGVTLPLVSYGGSSTLAAFAALGLVLNFGTRRETEFGEEGYLETER